MSLLIASSTAITPHQQELIYYLIETICENSLQSVLIFMTICIENKIKHTAFGGIFYPGTT